MNFKNITNFYGAFLPVDYNFEINKNNSYIIFNEFDFLKKNSLNNINILIDKITKKEQIKEEMIFNNKYIKTKEGFDKIIVLKESFSKIRLINNKNFNFIKTRDEKNDPVNFSQIIDINKEKYGILNSNYIDNLCKLTIKYYQYIISEIISEMEDRGLYLLKANNFMATIKFKKNLKMIKKIEKFSNILNEFLLDFFNYNTVIGIKLMSFEDIENMKSKINSWFEKNKIGDIYYLKNKKFDTFEKLHVIDLFCNDYSYSTLEGCFILKNKNNNNTYYYSKGEGLISLISNDYKVNDISSFEYIMSLEKSRNDDLEMMDEKSFNDYYERFKKFYLLYKNAKESL